MLQSKPKIGIVISSTREGRFGEKPAKWIHDLAAARGDLDVELIDLRDYPMPFFEEATSPAYAAPADDVARAWAAKVDSLDGFIFVTAEYNRAPTAVLKNALDYAYREFNRKPAAYVGYGGVGAARAVEQLRLINVELQMAPTRNGVHIGGADFLGLWQGGRSFEEMPHLAQSAGVLLDELAWWAKALKTAREATLLDAAAA
ncbi:NADPH-dependent FMN reductase [Phenylobacterium terrae]|uniref:NADPH-dependent FMN reductase n=1 Tax=Phenylobacterium terrae TaxID=2665495 RepID=A0ABW4N5K1_9CAUL